MATEIPRHSVSVAAAIADDGGRLLAIHRRDNAHWEPPKGLLELNEAIYEGLVREVQEETGLTIEPLALTGVYKNMKTQHRRPRLPMPYHRRRATCDQGDKGVSVDDANRDTEGT